MQPTKKLVPLIAISAMLGGCATGLETTDNQSVSASAYNKAMADQGRAYYCGDGRCDTPPELIHATAPEYPVSALAEEREGWASVLFDIEATGEISNASLEFASAPEFGMAAMSVIHTWKYKPASLNDKPVKINAVRQPIPFSLSAAR
jgi:TonB family protein